MKRLRNKQLGIQRIILLVLGAMVSATGITGLFLAYGSTSLSQQLDPSSALLNGPGYEFFQQHAREVRVGSMLLALVLVALSIWWLELQIPPRLRQDNLSYTTSDPSVTPGTNVVTGDALARAFENNLEQSPDITRARAEFRLSDDVIRLRLDVHEGVDIHALLTNTLGKAIERISLVSEMPRMPRVQTDIRLVQTQRVLT